MAARKTTKRMRHVRWDTTAKRWLERNLMPNGTTLVLERIKDRRRVRGDLILHRGDLPPASNGADTVAQALATLQAIFITDIKARGQRIRLYRPDGSCANGGMLMRTMRELPGLPTEQEKVTAEQLDSEIENVADSLRLEFEVSEDMVSSPDVLLRAFVRALRDKFSREQIATVMQQEW